MFRIADTSDNSLPPSPDTSSNRTTEAGDSGDSSPGEFANPTRSSGQQLPASAIWSSAATLAFHPTGSAPGCGSLFNGSAGGGHHHYPSGCSNPMAYLKSNPYAMAGITTPDLLHSGYPGESLPLFPLCDKRLNSSKCWGDGFASTQLPGFTGKRNYRKQGISLRGSKSMLCMYASPAANCRRSGQFTTHNPLFQTDSSLSRANVSMNILLPQTTLSLPDSSLNFKLVIMIATGCGSR
jgi:hypothetical protein